MEQFNDISKQIEKAQGDKARFLESKKGLLPQFEFPSGEDKEEKHYSKETLLADIMEERLKGVSETMRNPILLENVYQYVGNNVIQGSEREGKDINCASLVFVTFSALISTNLLSRLSPEKQNEINSYLENPVLLENTYRVFQNNATLCSEKEEKNTGYIFSTLQIISALISTNFLSRLPPEKQNEINSYLENPILLENAYQYIQERATRGSNEEGKNAMNAYWVFRTISSLITTHTLPRLSPEQQNQINAYIENSILLENAYRDLQYDATLSSEKEGENTDNASWALQTLSTFIFTDALSHLSKEKQNEINSFLENPILLENAYRHLQNTATRGSQKEGENTDSASWAFRTLSALISTNSISHLSPEKQNTINAYIENSTFLENAYRHLQDAVTEGSKKEGEDINNASYAFRVLSSLITVKDYLREKGKKIDEETFANEALNPTESIPPRPETRNNY